MVSDATGVCLGSSASSSASVGAERRRRSCAPLPRGMRSAAGSAGAAAGAEPSAPRTPRVLLAVTGSVAAVKVPLLAAELLRRGAEVRVCATQRALAFFDAASVRASGVEVLTDEDEWGPWKRVGDPVLHIELRRWADVLVVAPLSANSLAKCANGLADNLVTCVFRAWDFAAQPVLVAPAMNTFMWESPFTSKQLGVLEELGVLAVPTVVKALACGDVGDGAMAEYQTIADAVQAVTARLKGCSPLMRRRDGD